MPHPLDNPFRPRSKPSKTEAEVIGDFLGAEARGEFEKVSGRAARIDDFDFEITDEEREEMRRLKHDADEGALERNGKWTKKRYIIWAESFDEDEEWVDEHFEFQADGTTITPGNIDLDGKGLTELPKGWARVEGNCYLHNNQLTSLAGAPENVGGDFYCDNNQLTSLAGAPKNVEGNFFCHNNQLTSLAGAPESVGRGFSCSHNQLTSLAGAPKNVEGNFYCDNNQLTSLAGAPKSVEGAFWCYKNQLTSLDDLPENISGRIYARNNPLTQETIERARVKWGEKLNLKN